MTVRHSSGARSMTGTRSAPRAAPALLTTMSTRPNSASTDCASTSTAAGSDTSLTTATAGRPRACTSSPTASMLFAAAGAKVVVAAVDVVAGNDVASRTGSHFAPLDVTSPESWERIVDMLVTDFGRIDVLYNSAGIIAWHTMTETPLAVWER